jgi:TatD family-associated radical SAM protein
MPEQIIAYEVRNNLYLNITDRCTLHCHFCPKHNGSHQLHQYDLTLQHRPTTEQLIDAIGSPANYQEVVFCGYGEPTLRLNVLLEVADFIKSHQGRTRLNTDGLANLVHKRNVLPELGRVIDAVSVSMNAADADTYQRHCQPALAGSFNAMLSFLAAAPKYVTTVTATAIDGLEGVNIDHCRSLSSWLGVRFRRRELDVVG